MVRPAIHGHDNVAKTRAALEENCLLALESVYRRHAPRVPSERDDAPFRTDKFRELSERLENAVGPQAVVFVVRLVVVKRRIEDDRIELSGNEVVRYLAHVNVEIGLAVRVEIVPNNLVVVLEERPPRAGVENATLETVFDELPRRCVLEGPPTEGSVRSVAIATAIRNDLVDRLESFHSARGVAASFCPISDFTAVCPDSVVVGSEPSAARAALVDGSIDLRVVRPMLNLRRIAVWAVHFLPLAY
ncbi:hypothetical protein [Natrialba aegyptia]|uniref:hypothetical protein n=1 Tax=Natrialba aegyptia TaxID=129789 RepID=UPI000A7C5D80|nr:hypothetical protein [Natrialba aegyptia]